MTITITCAITGIEFEASSKRQKNHPLVSAFLDDANSDGKYTRGAYRQAREILESVNGSDIDTIEDALEYAQAEYDAWKEAAGARQARKSRSIGQYLREKKERQAQRQETNARLKFHGYRWHKETEESMDAFGANAFQNAYGNRNHAWQLVAPDGREVTVEQALAEINAR